MNILKEAMRAGATADAISRATSEANKSLERALFAALWIYQQLPHYKDPTVPTGAKIDALRPCVVDALRFADMCMDVAAGTKKDSPDEVP
jgi:hypothetical protein